MGVLGREVVREADFWVVEARWCAVGSEVIDWGEIRSSPRSTLRDRVRESAGQYMGCASSILLSANPLFSCSGLEQPTESYGFAGCTGHSSMYDSDMQNTSPEHAPMPR